MNAVYIMASRKHGTLYIGVTSDLLTRVTQHRDGTYDGFTKQYGVRRLLWSEWHEGIAAAIHREKRLKKYRREWKINLIEGDNPEWDDLFPQFLIEAGPLAHLQPREQHRLYRVRHCSTAVNGPATLSAQDFLAWRVARAANQLPLRLTTR